MSAAPQIPDSLHHLKEHLGPASNGIHSTGYSSGKTNGLNHTTNGEHAQIDGTSHSEDHATRFELHNVPVENFRPLKVVVIGAGYSGIYLGIRIPERLRNVDLTIYDKNAGVGGTWYENRYPGCACDIPSHSYQYSFNPNTNWSALYAPAAEIQQYLEGTAKKFGATRFIKLSHKVQECRYDEGKAKWYLVIRNLETDTEFIDTADVLINARGSLNEPNWPEIEGLETFKGKVMHSARWDESYDFKNKKIGVIGNGSSSIQIVPALQEVEGTHLSCFVRNKTWISPPFGQDLWDEMGMNGIHFSEEQKAAFAADPAAYHRFRLQVEEGGNAIHSFTMKGTAMQLGAQDLFAKSMSERLASRPDIFKTLLPSFAPGCRRLTPGRGYLEALCEPNVDFINSGIASLDSSGLTTQDGSHHPLDVLVCATGFKAGAPPPFPIFGTDDTVLSKHWAAFPRTYLSLATDNFPNFFMMLGPNSAIGSGSLTMMIESVGDYIVRCVRKIQKENIRAMTVKPARVDDFLEYSGEYFKRTVFSDDCRSWYKNARNEVTGLWPGSTQHCLEVMRSPRWEDFEYVYVGEGQGKEGNRLTWLGNGWTDNQIRERHQAWYLYPEFVDVPTEGKPEEKKVYDVRPFSH